LIVYVIMLYTSRLYYSVTCTQLCTVNIHIQCFIAVVCTRGMVSSLYKSCLPVNQKQCLNSRMMSRLNG